MSQRDPPRPADEKTSEGTRRAIFVALLANLAIAATKVVGFVVTGAISLLAEAVHSFADTADQGLLFLGTRRARHRPTPTHPFGYGREHYFWAFVVAVVLFTGGGLFALYEATEKLRHPHELTSIAWAIGILAAAMFFEGMSLRTAVKRARPLKGDQSWRSFIHRSKEAELPVVLLEDSGALIGLVFAFLGVSLSAIVGDPRFDALGSFGIGVLLVVIAFTLAVEMKSLLIGESAPKRDVEIAYATIDDDPQVRGIVDLRTQQLGPDEILIGARLQIADEADDDVTATLERIEQRLRGRIPSAHVVYLQPVHDQIARRTTGS